MQRLFKKKEFVTDFLADFKEFGFELANFLARVTRLQFLRFEEGKGVVVNILYRKRGKMSKRLVHSGMAGLAGLGMIIAPAIAQEFPGRSADPWSINSPSSVLSASTENPVTSTAISDDKRRGEVIEYEVQEGDTVSTIAEKFDISTDTIRWQNDLTSKDSIKQGQILEILPLTGIAHKVKKGDTVYSIAKRYDVDPQGIVNYPFNTYVNDETFELAIGQTIIVPEGIMPATTPWSAVARVQQLTPDAGTVVASGSFVWPTSGRITQRFVWYHPAIDIANQAAPAILAADSGTVVGAGWLDGYGYGNRVIIDHGNGYRTLYAHLSKIYVTTGQTVNRGDAIGQMGSTGRSTGVHLHFEVLKNGVHLNPLTVLK
jgi:murein DD-endopeptidase MepM/ murein hydrolase activator NlpD